MGVDDSAAMAEITAAGAKISDKIWDPAFRRAHERLVLLSGYCLQVVTDLDPKAQEAAQLGTLNVMAFAMVPYGNRPALASEWSAVETRTHALWSALSEPQRRRFAGTQVPGWFSYVVTALLVVALASVVVAAFAIQRGSPATGELLLPFLAFVVALGAMGGGASIGMNALSVQDDATFDLSSRKFLWLRLVLGALLGTMLTIPWAYSGFHQFVTTLAGSAPADGGGMPGKEQLAQGLWLLAPFVLGFSTSLVILILVRAVEALQSFFGKASGPKA